MQRHSAASARKSRAADRGAGANSGLLLEHEQLAAALAAHDEAAAVAVLGTHLRPVEDILAQLPERP